MVVIVLLIYLDLVGPRLRHRKPYYLQDVLIRVYKQGNRQPLYIVVIGVAVRLLNVFFSPLGLEYTEAIDIRRVTTNVI